MARAAGIAVITEADARLTTPSQETPVTSPTEPATHAAEPAETPAATSARLTDPRFLEFLRARRAEEAASAATRAQQNPDQAARAEKGLALLDELIDGVAQGRDLDFMSLELLKIAYSRHPEFHQEWHPTLG